MNGEAIWQTSDFSYLKSSMLLSVAEGQRPRNYLSCCCSYSLCSWIFYLIYAFSTPHTLKPLHFFLSLLLLSLSLPYISLPLSVSHYLYLSLSLSLSYSSISQSLNVNIQSPHIREPVSVLLVMDYFPKSN